MKSFSEYLKEAMAKSATFTFGRFQPATIGHEKLFKALKANSRGGDVYIFTSQTQDKKDNPLSYQEKTDMLKGMFPQFASSVVHDTSVKTIIDAMKFLASKGYVNVKLVVGEDRVEKFDELLNKYNGGDDFKFDVIEVVSAGVRDPDADGAEGMSASKMRAAVRANDKEAFMKGIPKSYKKGGETLFNELSKRLK